MVDTMASTKTDPTLNLNTDEAGDIPTGVNRGVAAMTIDVVSDVVCPWCFVGKRQLEQAVDQWKAAHPQEPAPVINWLPFQLNPDMPIQGIERQDYLQRKFGHSDGGKIYTNVRRAALEVGLSLNMQAIRRQPSTLRPHALLKQAAEQGVQEALAEALFKAYFIDSRDLSSRYELRAIASSVGLTAGRIDRALDNELEHAAVAEADLQARENGISGVPFFILNRRVAVSGAAGAEHLLQAMAQAQAQARLDSAAA